MNLWYRDYLLFFVLPVAAPAQDQPDPNTSRLAQQLSNDFLAQMVQEDFVAEREFMSQKLTAVVSFEDREKARRNTIKVAGKTRRHAIHKATYYQQENLLAA